LYLQKWSLKISCKYSIKVEELITYTSLELKLKNTGRKTIRNQTFTCLFADETKSIDPNFPIVSTQPEREVGPMPYRKLCKKISLELKISAFTQDSGQHRF
jgi:hypothetical protein